MARDFTGGGQEVYLNETVESGSLGASFDASENWTSAVWFYPDNLNNNRVISLNRYQGVSAQRQFRVRTADDDDPDLYQVYWANSQRYESTEFVIDRNEWHVCWVTNTDSSVCRVSIWNPLHPAGPTLKDASGDITSVNASTAQGSNATISNRQYSGARGAFAFAFYLDGLALDGDEEIRSYCHNPHAWVTRAKGLSGGTVELYWPLLGLDPEPDWSGLGNHGYIQGSSVVFDMPPVNWTLAGGEFESLPATAGGVAADPAQEIPHTKQSIPIADWHKNEVTSY